MIRKMVSVTSTILVEPQNKAAMYGDTIAFKVSVTYDPLVDFQWFKSDTMIPNARDSVLVFDTCYICRYGEYFVFVIIRALCYQQTGTPFCQWRSAPCCKSTGFECAQ
jgi:hypothetical protein